MRLLRVSALVLLLVLPVFSARAQWSGKLDLTAGTGWQTGNEEFGEETLFHHLAKGKLTLEYKKDKLLWGTQLEGSWEPKSTDEKRISVKGEELGITVKQSDNRPAMVMLRQDLSWQPSPSSRYAAWLKCQYKRTTGINHSMNLTVNSDSQLGYTGEEPDTREYDISGGLNHSRWMGTPGRVFFAELSTRARGTDKYTVWSIVDKSVVSLDDILTGNVDESQFEIRKYRLTPYNIKFDHKLVVHVKDSTVKRPDLKLVLDPGGRIMVSHSLDQNSGANQRKMPDGSLVWQDSVRLKETFNFLDVRLEPYVAGDLVWKHLKGHFDYALQIYSRRLNDESHRQRLKFYGPYVVGKGFLEWPIGPSHSMTFSNDCSVRHPDYLNICWYDRTGGYADQLFRGNPDLKSTRTREWKLGHTFKNSHWQVRTSVGYTRKVDEIDRTWVKEEIDGRTYKVFTWVNSADSRKYIFSEQVEYKWRFLVSHLTLDYNHTWRVAREGGETKDSFDWKLTGDVSASLKKGWKLKTDFAYKSKAATFYTMFNEYCALNVRVEKAWGRFVVYLEGKDLLDNPVETQFISADQTEIWVNVLRSNRRQFLLGMSWKF